MSKTIKAKPFRETTPEEEKQRHEWRKRKRQIEQALEETMLDEFDKIPPSLFLDE